MYPPKLLCSMLVLLLWSSIALAQGMLIGTGAHVVVAGSPHIVISNAHWTNNGFFEPGTGRVYLSEGSKGGGNYFLRGDSVSRFYHLSIFTFPTAVLQVLTDAYVIARLDISGHIASVGDADIVLGPGAVLGTDGGGMLTGNNGRVLTTVMLDRPQQANPGNLGVEITSNENLGLTTVVRGFREQVNAAGEKSIERYYDIIPSNQPSMPVSLKFQYEDAELNGNTKSRLAVFSGRPGGKLSMLPAFSNDAGSNRASVARVSQLQRFTLGNAVANLQPEVEKTNLKVYPNPFRDRFTITLYSDAAKSVELRLLSVQGTLIERKIVQLQAGNNILEWPAAGYLPGTYQLVVGGDLRKAIKLVKQ